MVQLQLTGVDPMMSVLASLCPFCTTLCTLHILICRATTNQRQRTITAEFSLHTLPSCSVPCTCTLSPVPCINLIKGTAQAPQPTGGITGAMRPEPRTRRRSDFSKPAEHPSTSEILSDPFPPTAATRCDPPWRGRVLGFGLENGTVADATEGKPQEPRSHGSCSAADSVNFNRGDFTEYSMYILCNLGALVGLGGEGLEDRAAIWGGPRLLHRGWGCGGLRSRLGISSKIRLV